MKGILDRCSIRMETHQKNIQMRGTVVPILTMKLYDKWRYSFTHSYPGPRQGGWSVLRVHCFMPGERSPLYPLSKRLSGHQSQSMCFSEEKDLLPLLGTKSQFVGCIAHSLVTVSSHPGPTIRMVWEDVRCKEECVIVSALKALCKIHSNVFPLEMCV
jgi:hypothetical protein